MHHRDQLGRPALRGLEGHGLVPGQRLPADPDEGRRGAQTLIATPARSLTDAFDRTARLGDLPGCHGWPDHVVRQGVEVTGRLRGLALLADTTRRRLMPSDSPATAGSITHQRDDRGLATSAVSASPMATPAATRQSSPTTKSHQKSPGSAESSDPAPARSVRRRDRDGQAVGRARRRRGDDRGVARLASVAPAPSAPQYDPNDVSMTPTASFSEFSGTRASGARTATARTTTTTTAAAAANAAKPMLPWLAPKVSTMKTTSSPPAEHL